MANKYIYLLEHYIENQPTNVGVFTSRKKSESFLKTLPKRHAYTIYQLPLNQNLVEGIRLKDQQGIYEHWHYGTHEVEYTLHDDDGNILDAGREIKVIWPE